MDYLFEEEIIKHFFEKAKSLIIPDESNNYKSRFLQSNFLLYCVVLILVVKICSVLISINIPQNIFFADITKSALENFLNQTRQSSGLQPLIENVKLNQAAQLKAENMVQEQYFSHNSPSGVTPWFWFLKAGYSYHYAGENLAVGFFDSEEVFDAWLNSPSHKANILNPNYTDVGTAIVKGFGQNNSVVVVQEFGSLLPAKIAVETKQKKPVVKNQQPAPVAPDTSKTENLGEKVLSQTTNSQSIIAPAGNNTNSGLLPKMISSALYSSDKWLQEIVFGVSMLVIGSLITLIFFNFKITFKKQLVFRATFLILLLSLAALINKEALISIIPHQIII
ncbi:MAG: CAP domain-containing protein [Candidatus Staskawiczbacteria bacterium]|nr:CAP domain-containing protein [Candidatus Staskawiczbacteria bacterium]